jgi:hypothetical protein
MNFLLKKKMIKMNNLTIILLSFILIYLAILVIIFFFQRNLLYHPKDNNYSRDKISVFVEKVNIKTQDELDLLAWYHNKNSSDYKTILFLHGNAVYL